MKQAFSKSKPQIAVARWAQRIAAHVAASEFLLATCIVAVIIVTAVGIGWENNKLVPANPAASAHYSAEASSHLSFLANWDGRDYLAIEQHGYQGAVQTNFFPLYPLTVRMVNFVVPSPLYSALLVTWAAFVGAVYCYLKILKQLYPTTDNREALRGALFFILFPTGVFLLAVYTEALFALLALGAVYSALRQWYLRAALLGLLASATHVTGVFVLAFIAMLLLEQRTKLWKVGLGLAIGSSGLLTYMIFLAVRWHNPIAFIASQKVNGWLHYGHKGLLAELVTRKAAFLLLVIISVVYWWRRRKSFALYSLLYVCIVFLGGLGAYGRYALMAFPVPLMAYDYLRDKELAYALVLALFGVGWTYFTLQYMGGYSGG